MGGPTDVGPNSGVRKNTKNTRRFFPGFSMWENNTFVLPESMDSAADIVFFSTSRYDTCDDSDASLLDHDIALTSPHWGRRGTRSQRRTPKKIIITVKPTDVLTYPILRLSQCLTVMRFQKSVVDFSASSDGVYRDVLAVPHLITFSSPAGFGFVRDLVKSVWRRHGFLGFFRGFPEFIVYRLLRDLTTFVVPSYIAPHVEEAGDILGRSILQFEHASLRHLRQRCMASLGDWFNKDELAKHNNTDAFFKADSVVDFLRRNFKFSSHELMTQVLVELLTYPMLTVSSRMMIYDGRDAMDAMKLLKYSIVCDGPLSLYSGFTWRLVSRVCLHLQRQHERRSRNLSFALDEHHNALDQSVPIFLTIASTLFEQLSMVQRCMSTMDGFCSEASTLSVLSKFPWLNISAQLVLSICVMQLKNRMV